MHEIDVLSPGVSPGGHNTQHTQHGCCAVVLPLPCFQSSACALMCFASCCIAFLFLCSLLPPSRVFNKYTLYAEASAPYYKYLYIIIIIIITLSFPKPRAGCSAHVPGRDPDQRRSGAGAGGEPKPTHRATHPLPGPSTRLVYPARLPRGSPACACVGG